MKCIVALFLLMIYFPERTVFATTCNKSDFAESYVRTSAVFIGKVIKTDKNTTRFSVFKVYKGAEVKTVSLKKSPFVSGAVFKPGSVYLVYQSGDYDNICGGSMLKSDASKQISILDQIRPGMSEDEIRSLSASFDK